MPLSFVQCLHKISRLIGDAKSSIESQFHAMLIFKIYCDSSWDFTVEFLIIFNEISADHTQLCTARIRLKFAEANS